MIAKCECKHEGQDKMYGVGMRVYNQAKTTSRCSVCGKTKDISKKEEKKK